MNWTAGLLVALVVAPSTIWAALAVHYRSPNRALRWARSLTVLLLVAVAAVRRWPAPEFWIVWGITIAAVMVWFRRLRPRADRDWAVGLDVLPRVALDGDRVVVRNFRNFDHDAAGRTTPRYETREFDLTKLRGLDYCLSHWSGPIMAHTLVGFAFDDGGYLMVSVEARRQKWQSYSPLWGLFRAYEIAFVIGDEHDVIRLRTKRGERVLRYRLNLTAEQIRMLLVDYLTRAEELASRPQWYDSVTSNCTTNLFYHRHRRRRWWMYPGVFLNGLSARTLYRLGFLDRDISFAELQSRAELQADRRDSAAALPAPNN